MDRPVEFECQGDKIAAVLRLPEGASRPMPLVVMAGGWCYTKEIVMPYYAKHFLDAGVATLLLDYRCFGESGGEPRQHIDPLSQVEDYKAAISYAETLDEIDSDRIGVWGISYSGGHVLIVAASDPRVKWAISTIPVVDGFNTMRRCHGERRFRELREAIVADRRARFETGGPGAYIPMSSPTPDTEMCSWPFAHVCEIFNEIKAKEAPLHEHRNTIESVELLMMYNVSPFCRLIYDVPVMMSIAQGDNITSADLEIDAFNEIPAPNKVLDIAAGITHMSLYNNIDNLARVGGAQAEWLKGVLGV